MHRGSLWLSVCGPDSYHRPIFPWRGGGGGKWPSVASRLSPLQLCPHGEGLLPARPSSVVSRGRFRPACHGLEAGPGEGGWLSDSHILPRSYRNSISRMIIPLYRRRD